VDSLAKKPTRRDVRLALESLPKELDDTYHEALQRIWDQDEGDVKLARQVLSWISFAIRPLALNEVQHALAIEPGDTDIDGEALPEEDLLVSACAGLVTLDRESNIIRLVHHTTQKYFERIRMSQFPDGQISITKTCLTYLSLDILAGHCNSDELNNRLQKYPLLRYAALHWGDHARGGPEEVIQELILRFLEDKFKLSCTVQVMHIPKYQRKRYSQQFPRNVTALQLAASFGLEKISSILLEMGAEVAAEDSRGWTAIHRAAEEGYEAVVRLLLQAGATVDAKTKNGGTALYRAARCGHGAVVQLLLQAGAAVDAKDENGWIALHWAAESGHDTVVQLLLQAGAAVDTMTKSGWTALHCAAGSGHDTVVQLLLQAGAAVDTTTESGWTALHCAAGSGHDTVVQLLLEKGADLAVADKDGWTPLCLASIYGHVNVVKLLLEKGADLAVADKVGWTPLCLASKNGHADIVKLLLEKGADIAVASNDGRTPLR